MQAYQDIARRLKLPGSEDPQIDTCHLVSNWLDEADGDRWLVIVDNADDASLFLHNTVIKNVWSGGEDRPTEGRGAGSLPPDWGRLE
jgi:hypothetical protein